MKADQLYGNHGSEVLEILSKLFLSDPGVNSADEHGQVWLLNYFLEVAFLLALLALFVLGDQRLGWAISLIAFWDVAVPRGKAELRIKEKIVDIVIFLLELQRRVRHRVQVSCERPRGNQLLLILLKVSRYRGFLLHLLRPVGRRVHNFRTRRWVEWSLERCWLSFVLLCLEFFMHPEKLMRARG